MFRAVKMLEDKGQMMAFPLVGRSLIFGRMGVVAKCGGGIIFGLFLVERRSRGAFLSIFCRKKTPRLSTIL